MQLKSVRTGTLAEIGQQADLAVVVGGDGNMLGAARTLARYDIKVIGVNRGNLGFLTDLDPDNAQQQLADVLEGHYISEKGFAGSPVCQQDCQKRISTAINEVVLHPGKVAHMIEFEVYIDEIFAFSQRSDGLIISTRRGPPPTRFQPEVQSLRHRWMPLPRCRCSRIRSRRVRW